MRKILEKTGGEFDLVTCAFLEEGGLHAQPPESYSATIVHPVLKIGGVYHNETYRLEGTAVKLEVGWQSKIR